MKALRIIFLLLFAVCWVAEPSRGSETVPAVVQGKATISSPAAVPSAVRPVLLGKTEAEIMAEKGKPVSKTAAGTRAIYRWNDAVLTFDNGRVSKVEFRDSKRESESETAALKAKQDALRDAEAKKKSDKAINDKYLADSIAQHANDVRAEQQQQADKAREEQLQKFREAARLQNENAQTARLPFRPKTAKEQEADNAAATKQYNDSQK